MHIPSPQILAEYNLLLTGMRGSGKSAIGALLAKQMSRRFVDLDQLTLGHFSDQSSVTGVWRVHGEKAWRAAEIRAMQEVMKGAGQVIALGGGTAMIPEALSLITAAKAAGRAVVIYLRATISTLAQRLENDAGDRPALTSLPLPEEIARVLTDREPTYLRLADLVCDTDSISISTAAERILQQLQSRAAADADVP